MSKKRIMREFQMDEISTVDRPAQKGAKMTIMKRDTSQEEINKEDKTMTDKTLEEVTKNLNTVSEENKALKDKLEKAEKFASLSDEEKTFIAKMDEKAKADFMALSADERKKKLTDAKKNDETVEIAGQVISKNEVGAAAFAVMKAQAASIKDAEARISKAEKAAAMAGFEKRAKDEFSHLPGADAKKAEVLEAMSKLDPEVVKSLEAMLKAGEEAVKDAFVTKGTNKAPAEDSPEGKLEKKAKDIQKANTGMTYHQAYAKALMDNPELYKE